MAVLISHAYDCVIRKYIDFAYLEKRNALTLEGDPTEQEITEAWQQINNEFSDYSNSEKDFKVENHYPLQIYRMRQRIEIISCSLSLQRTAIDITGEPLIEGFVLFKAKGHNLVWNNDVTDFQTQIEMVFNKEKQWKMRLAITEKEYEDELAEKKRNEPPRATTTQKGFVSFIELLNNLKARGYPFDKDKDTMMDVAVTIMSLNKQKQNIPQE